MKKFIMLSLFTLTFLNVGCNKKSSTSNEVEAESGPKCPHCGSHNISNAEPGGRILECNSCGVGFENY